MVNGIYFILVIILTKQIVNFKKRKNEQTIKLAEIGRPDSKSMYSIHTYSEYIVYTLYIYTIVYIVYM